MTYKQWKHIKKREKILLIKYNDFGIFLREKYVKTPLISEIYKLQSI